MKRIVLTVLMVAGFALASGMAGAAEGVVLEKNVTKQTLLLEGPKVLAVDANTVMSDVRGLPITFGELRTAKKIPLGYEFMGDEAIAYEAKLVNGRLLASKIRMLSGAVD